jgi:protein involved in polysaccharide export with SLBB domain
VRVSLDGSIELPLIGNIHVDGMTLHEAQDLIAKKLIDAGMYQNPQVTIQMVESPNQIATVVGELHGIVPIVGERYLAIYRSSRAIRSSFRGSEWYICLARSRLRGRYRFNKTRR